MADAKFTTPLIRPNSGALGATALGGEVRVDTGTPGLWVQKDTPTTAWAAKVAGAVHDQVVPVVSNGRWYRATVAPTGALTGITQPTWPTTTGTTVRDNQGMVVVPDGPGVVNTGEGYLKPGGTLADSEWYEVTTGGTPATAGTHPAYPTTAGEQVTDGTAILTCRKTITWVDGGVSGWVLLATPSGSAVPTAPASEAGQGIVELATAAEITAGTAGTLVPTAARLKEYIDARTATETQTGVAEVATQTETDAGTDNTRIVTPARLAGRAATETLSGIAELATQTETDTGTDTTRIVTPARLAGRTSTEARTGVVELATSAETQTGTDSVRAVHSAGLKSELDRRIPVGPCIVSRTGIQAVIDSTTTLVNWQSEIYDPDNLHDNVTNNSRVTVTGFTGTRAFHVSAYVVWESSATGSRRIWLFKNGAQVVREAVLPVAAEGSTCPATITADIQAVSGDYFEVQVWHDRGSSLNVEPASRFSVAPIPE